jgi:hypothetical protein
MGWRMVIIISGVSSAELIAKSIYAQNPLIQIIPRLDIDADLSDISHLPCFCV